MSAFCRWRGSRGYLFRSSEEKTHWTQAAYQRGVQAEQEGKYL